MIRGYFGDTVQQHLSPDQEVNVYFIDCMNRAEYYGSGKVSGFADCFTDEFGFQLAEVEEADVTYQDAEVSGIVS